MSQKRRNTTHNPDADKSRQGQLDLYFPGTRGKAQEKSKMATASKATEQHTATQKQPVQPARSPQPSPGLVSDTASLAPLLPGLRDLILRTSWARGTLRGTYGPSLLERTKRGSQIRWIKHLRKILPSSRTTLHTWAHGYRH